MISIASYCSHESPACAIAECNHRRYALRHGYRYMSPTRNSTAWWTAKLMVHGTRFKTRAVLEEMDVAHFVFWIDGDALFLRMDESLDGWIRIMDDRRADIFVARDKPGYPFNAGVMLIRSTDWSRNFFRRAVAGISKRSPDSRSQDQPVFFDLLARNEHHEHSRIYVYPNRVRFQAMLKMDVPTPESFIVHLTCCADCDTKRFDPVCFERVCPGGDPACSARVSVCPPWYLNDLALSALFFLLAMTSVTVFKSCKKQQGVQFRIP